MSKKVSVSIAITLILGMVIGAVFIAAISDLPWGWQAFGYAGLVCAAILLVKGIVVAIDYYYFGGEL